MTKKIQSIPEARLLLESLRSVGYNEETAIADIIDNCISAKAHEIKIQFDWEKKRIVISDDGLGMSSKDLIENMRIGSSDPNQVRDERDLGRFGMGMKTAAFSLGKKLTVVTKSNSTVSNASWDLEQIPSIGWNLIIRDESEISEFSSQIDEQGTIVIIENLDRVIDTDDEKKAKNKFYRIANRTEKHLALTFHRFIEEDCLILELNDIPIKAWNPFIVENSATQELPEESVFSDNGCIKAIIQPYVLPHKTKFASDDDYQLAGGPKGWNYHQGIYVYRNKRLIICGTWFDYIKKEPAYNLARIKIDISSASDEDWKIDIKKSTASLPSYVREAVEREIDLCTEASARVYNSRGNYSKSNVSTPNLDYVWEQRKKDGRYSFYINRKHSLLNTIKKQLDEQGILLTNDETVQYTPNDTHNGKVTIRFDVWDIERLYQTVLGGAAIERQLVVKLKKKYGTSLPLIKVKGDNAIYDCYIGVISGRLLAQIYEAEGQDLIQKNVRSFLQATGNVNKGIKASLANEPEMFMAYNNGISTIAESVAVDESQCNGDISTITEITGWQIVNGGQTTASIYNAYRAKLPLDQVNVQIKLSVIKQKDRAEDIIHNISKYANSQNKINMSDFNANDAYHVKMERLSRATPIPVAKGKSTDYWFYERARGQYLVELNRQPSATAKKEFKNRCPKSRCISKTVAAKCMMAYQGHPDIVSKGLETNFIYFSDMVSDGTFPEPSEQSYTEMIAKVILFNSCDKIIKNLKFGGFKAQQDYYTIALIGKYYSDLFHPQEIWNSQMISAEMAKTIEELAFFVWNHFQNPTVPGVNVGQWCKKEECWELLQARYENEYMQR